MNVQQNIKKKYRYMTAIRVQSNLDMSQPSAHCSLCRCTEDGSKLEALRLF